MGNRTGHRIDIVAKIDLSDGSFVGGGIVSGNPANTANVIGFRIVGPNDNIDYWMDMSPSTALAIISVLSQAILVYANTIGEMNPPSRIPTNTAPHHD